MLCNCISYLCLPPGIMSFRQQFPIYSLQKLSNLSHLSEVMAFIFGILDVGATSQRY